MRLVTRALRTLSLWILVQVLLTGCKWGSGGDASSAAERSLVVFAAASLREVFTELGREFERTHPGVEVTFNFAGSQELRAQIEHGAPADVLASADLRHMQELLKAALVEKPMGFCRNEPVVVVAPNAALSSFEQLAQAKRLVIGAKEVPIGRYSEQILERSRRRFGEEFVARVRSKIVSRELNVRQVLAKVILGEADAGIVYRTDARSAAGDVNTAGDPRWTQRETPSGS